MKTAPTVALALIALASLTAPGSANRINSGAADGPIHTHFCPLLAKQLQLAQFEVACAPSAGTNETIERVRQDPSELGFAPLDAFLHVGTELAARSALTVVRQDDVRQCLYAATRNRDLASWAALSANADRLRFIVPATDTATFAYLSRIDPNGLGRASPPRAQPSLARAIAETMSAEDTVSLFVSFPDPDSTRFADITDRGGHVIAVIDRNILRQEVNGKKVYFAQETEIENPRWTKAGHKLITACTPLVVFTGAADQVADGKARRDHEDLIRTIAALNAGALLPAQGLFSQLLKRTKELSALSTEKMLAATEQARIKARPYTDRAIETAKETAEQAKDAAARAVDAAKPYIDRSKAAAEKAYDDVIKMHKDRLQTPPDAPKEP
ncbi:MAG TPA: hypothetical protein VKF35_16250 [Hyphomicrobiaceae bacterium]|nr:hypothetical protein [Hyphomicrobiaceae bacterium]